MTLEHLSFKRQNVEEKSAANLRKNLCKNLCTKILRKNGCKNLHTKNLRKNGHKNLKIPFFLEYGSQIKTQKNLRQTFAKPQPPNIESLSRRRTSLFLVSLESDYFFFFLDSGAAAALRFHSSKDKTQRAQWKARTIRVTYPTIRERFERRN